MFAATEAEQDSERQIEGRDRFFLAQDVLSQWFLMPFPACDEWNRWCAAGCSSTAPNSAQPIPVPRVLTVTGFFLAQHVWPAVLSAAPSTARQIAGPHRLTFTGSQIE